MASLALDAIDGRKTRAERSREAICDACLDLVKEGNLQPSADDVAERAGVSRRSIFNHFGDLAELYDAVVDVGIRRAEPLLEEIAEDLPLRERVDRLVRVRSEFLEAASPFTRALTAQSLVGQAADQALRVSRQLVRLQHEEVERLFAAELGTVPADERKLIGEGISAALGGLQWEYLRHTRSNPVAGARAIVMRTIESLLRDAGFEV